MDNSDLDRYVGYLEGSDHSVACGDDLDKIQNELVKVLSLEEPLDKNGEEVALSSGDEQVITVYRLVHVTRFKRRDLPPWTKTEEASIGTQEDQEEDHPAQDDAQGDCEEGDTAIHIR